MIADRVPGGELAAAVCMGVRVQLSSQYGRGSSLVLSREVETPYQGRGHQYRGSSRIGRGAGTQDCLVT